MDAITLRTAWHHHVNERDHEAPADPWTVIRVDPAEITDLNLEIPVGWGLGRVDAGAWDRAEQRRALHDTAIVRGLRQRFEEGYEWEETALYERTERGFEDGRSVRGYEDIDEFRAARCRYLDTLFESIRKRGYRPNFDAEHDNPAATENAFEDAAVHRLEPIIAIGRDGDIMLNEGIHRIGITSILNVPEVPVQVLSRHEEWQEIRDEIHRTPAAD